jgi:glycosyltransferase involved in cell wall biosynthesis
MRILWIGPFFSDLALSEKKASNQAAAKWSRGLLWAMREIAGVEIRCVDHCPEQQWPMGKVFWQDNDSKWFLDWSPCERISYSNVVGFKYLYLAWAYSRAVRRICSEWIPDVVLCYNTWQIFNVAAMKTARKFGAKGVSIILDGNDPRHDNWRTFLRENRYADAMVFLSYWMVQNYPGNTVGVNSRKGRKLPCLHMDGGADEFKGSLPETSLHTPIHSTYTYKLVHIGALDKWRGLEFMRRVVKCCKRQDVRFVFCGKCDRAIMWAEFDNDPRVEIKGFLSNESIFAICCDADALLNVREPSVGDNILNYPSKVPNYLAYGKPVVSTWIDSFSPDYREVLDVCDNTSEGFVKVLDNVLARNEVERTAKFEQIKNWFLERKSWDKQAKRLVEFLKGLQ